MTWAELLEYLLQAQQEQPNLLENHVVFLSGEGFSYCDIAIGVNNGLILTVLRDNDVE